jgi:hypothetical protein
MPTTTRQRPAMSAPVLPEFDTRILGGCYGCGSARCPGTCSRRHQARAKAVLAAAHAALPRPLENRVMIVVGMACDVIAAQGPLDTLIASNYPDRRGTRWCFLPDAIRADHKAAWRQTWEDGRAHGYLSGRWAVAITPFKFGDGEIFTVSVFDPGQSV